MLEFEISGDFNKTESWLDRLLKGDMFSRLEPYARAGVNALSSSTPKDSGETSSLWNYEIKQSKTSCQIIWTNSHVVNGVPIAVILQYGHGTGTGGYVAGRDYINPAMKPVFDQIANEVWKVVTSA